MDTPRSWATLVIWASPITLTLTQITKVRYWVGLCESFEFGRKNNELPKRSLKWGKTRSKLYSLFRTERTKTIPCPPAHPCIGHKGLHPLASCSRKVLLRRVIPQDFWLENPTLHSCLNQHTDSTGCTTCDKICFTVFYYLSVYKQLQFTFWSLYNS